MRRFASAVPSRIPELARAASQLAALVALAFVAACARPGPPRLVGAACDGPAAFADAARANALSLANLDFAPFGRPERGWEIYAPALADTLRTPCPGGAAGFAAALSAWQAAHGLSADGRMTAEVFETFKAEQQGRRPFLALRARGICPDPPPAEALEQVERAEAADDRPILLRRDALAAYRAMTAAARREVPDLAGDPDALKLFSGYRSPAYDDARCARDGDCQGTTRAQCSAHRTGLALDLIVGFAPGAAADSSADANRLHQTRTAAYRWLIGHARRFGFVNYLFEPWHWEWIGMEEDDVATLFEN